MYGPGMAGGYQSYMVRPQGAAPWEDPSYDEAAQIQWEMEQRNQASLNRMGGALGRAGRQVWQSRPQAPTAIPQMTPPPAYSSSMGMGGFQPQTGMTLPQLAGKVAGPVGMALNTYQGLQGGAGYADAAAALEGMHPDDVGGARRDIRKAAAREGATRMRAGAAQGAALGPVGMVAGAVGGAYGAMKGGSQAVGRGEMLRAMGAEVAKQQALQTGAAAATGGAMPGLTTWAAIKKLRKIL